MAPSNDDTRSLDDPRLSGGEWLFRKSGQIFGPVDSRRLADLLYRGEIDAGTPVTTGDGGDDSRWTPVGEVPIFVVHAKKAEARLRVEREITSNRALEARRGRRLAVAAGVALLVVLGSGGFAAWRWARGPVVDSRLLEDFGEGIRIVSAARVGVSHRTAGADEVEVTLDPVTPSQGRPERRPARPQGTAPAAGTTRGSAAGGDELVEARFDAGAIQAAVARQQRSLVPCFREEAARSRDFRGQVPLEFTIGNDGRVAALWIDEPRFREGALKECVSRALAAWRFDPFPGQRPTVQLAFGVGG